MQSSKMLLRFGVVEASRWLSTQFVLVAFGVSCFLGGLISFVGVGVASGSISGGQGGVSVDAGQSLDSQSTGSDLVNFVNSGVILVAPLLAIIIGALVAGRDMSTGAHLVVASAIRRLRLFSLARLGVLLVMMIVAALGISLSASGGASLGKALSPGLAEISVWDALGKVYFGSAIAMAVWGILSFSLTLLSRRWTLIMILCLLYLVVIEGIIASGIGAIANYLPRAATSAAVNQGNDWVLSLIPTVITVLLIAVMSVVLQRRTRVAT